MGFNNQQYERHRERRPNRLGMRAGAFVLALLTEEHLPWYESPGEVREGMKWGRRKAKQLAWVQAQMVLCLTEVERQCVHLYYFEGLTYRQAAVIMEMQPSSVYRAARRSIRKLREAARHSRWFRK